MRVPLRLSILNSLLINRISQFSLLYFVGATAPLFCLIVCSFYSIVILRLLISPLLASRFSSEIHLDIFGVGTTASYSAVPFTTDSHISRFVLWSYSIILSWNIMLIGLLCLLILFAISAFEVTPVSKIDRTRR